MTVDMLALQQHLFRATVSCSDKESFVLAVVGFVLGLTNARACVHWARDSDDQLEIASRHVQGDDDVLGVDSLATMRAAA